MMGQNTTNTLRLRVGLYKEKHVKLEYQDGNRLCPMVHIDDFVFEGPQELWKDALVGKLLGKILEFHTMKNKLQHL